MNESSSVQEASDHLAEAERQAVEAEHQTEEAEHMSYEMSCEAESALWRFIDASNRAVEAVHLVKNAKSKLEAARCNETKK